MGGGGEGRGKKYQSIGRENVNFADVACPLDKVTEHFVTMQTDAVTFALVTAYIYVYIYILRATILMISIPLRVIDRMMKEEREFRICRALQTDIIFHLRTRALIGN